MTSFIRDQLDEAAQAFAAGDLAGVRAACLRAATAVEIEKDWGLSETEQCEAATCQKTTSE
jgi:hypothetical protein